MSKLDPVNIAQRYWESVQENLPRSSYHAHRCLIPLVEEIQRYPRLRALYPCSSHAALMLSENTEFPYVYRRLPLAIPIDEGIFVVKVWQPPVQRGFWFWRRWHYNVPVIVGEGTAETAAALMNELLPADCRPALIGAADEQFSLRHPTEPPRPLRSHR